MGMLISLAIALIFTPWMCRKLFASETHDATAESQTEGKLHRFFVTSHDALFDRRSRAQAQRHRLYLGTAGAIVVAVLLAVVQFVVLKMLPFDNKSEFQVVVNMPEGTPVEGTARVLAGLANIVRTVPEVTDYQAYAGTAAPINFNGLVRQYYLRGDSNQGDLQVNLVDKQRSQPQEP